MRKSWSRWIITADFLNEDGKLSIKRTKEKGQ